MVEGERVGYVLRRDGFEDLHSPLANVVNHAGGSDGYIDTPQRAIAEDNIRRATEVTDQTDLPGIQVDRHQLPLVTGTEELSRTGVQIKAMGSLGRNREGLPNFRGMVGIDPHDERWIRDIHV